MRGLFRLFKIRPDLFDQFVPIHALKIGRIHDNIFTVYAELIHAARRNSADKVLVRHERNLANAIFLGIAIVDDMPSVSIGTVLPRAEPLINPLIIARQNDGNRLIGIYPIKCIRRSSLLHYIRGGGKACQFIL